MKKLIVLFLLSSCSFQVSIEDKKEESKVNHETLKNNITKTTYKIAKAPYESFMILETKDGIRSCLYIDYRRTASIDCRIVDEYIREDE